MPWSRLGHTPDLPPLHIPTAKIGRQHPDRVVETSTLSSVPPPDITYTLALPSSDSGALSALQLEAITYACQVISGSPTGSAACVWIVSVPHSDPVAR